MKKISTMMRTKRTTRSTPTKTTMRMMTTNSVHPASSARWLVPAARLAAAAGLLLALAASVWAGPPKPKDPSKDPHAPYALIEGTVWDANNQPFYGARVTIHLAGQKKPHWEHISDHRGEFAQRVPAGKADYIVTAEAATAKGTLKAEAAVHVESEERVDASLHLK
jgi:hypothetical protein